MDILGKGIFTWSPEERRSDRYGAFLLENTNYDTDASYSPVLNQDVFAKYKGKKVKLVAHILETRKSGHIGDAYLKILPSTPDVDAKIEIGNGIFDAEPQSWSHFKKQFVLKPSDGRNMFWINPEILYRLHDQTVEIMIEETTDNEHDVYQSKNHVYDDTAIINDYNSVQTKTKKNLESIVIEPSFQSLGDGLFVIEFPKNKELKLR